MVPGVSIVFPLQNERQDMLFVMTARYHVAILSFDPSTGDLVTRASGEMLVGLRGDMYVCRGEM